MSAFHKTTVTILQHVLAEQDRDLTLFQHGLERATAGASPTAVQSFRDQITELTAVAGDFRRLVTLALAANAADAAGLPAEITLDCTTVADVATEAFVDVADAERYAQRDEYVNSGLVDVAEAEAGHLAGVVQGLRNFEAQRARDAEAADDAMSASERFEHDQADEAKLDAEGWGPGEVTF